MADKLDKQDHFPTIEWHRTLSAPNKKFHRKGLDAGQYSMYIYTCIPHTCIHVFHVELPFASDFCCKTDPSITAIKQKSNMVKMIIIIDVQ